MHGQPDPFHHLAPVTTIVIVRFDRAGGDLPRVEPAP
jgi:hypothetical protein